MGVSNQPGSNKHIETDPLWPCRSSGICSSNITWTRRHEAGAVQTITGYMIYHDLMSIHSIGQKTTSYWPLTTLDNHQYLQPARGWNICHKATSDTSEETRNWKYLSLAPMLLSHLKKKKKLHSWTNLRTPVFRAHHLARLPKFELCAENIRVWCQVAGVYILDVVWSHFVSSLAATCGIRDERPVPSRRWDVGHEQMGMGMGWDGKEKESRSNEDHRWCQNALTGEPDRFMPLILKVTNSNSELSAPIYPNMGLSIRYPEILYFFTIKQPFGGTWYIYPVFGQTHTYIYIYIILIHIHMESKVSSDIGICWNSRRDAEQKPFLSLFPPTVVFAPVEEPYRGCYGWPYSKLLALCLLRTGSHRASATCMVPARNITAAAMARNRWTHVNTPVTTDKNTSFKLNERNHRVSSKILGASWCTFVPFIFWGLVQIGSIS